MIDHNNTPGLYGSGVIFFDRLLLESLSILYMYNPDVVRVEESQAQIFLLSTIHKLHY